MAARAVRRSESADAVEAAAEADEELEGRTGCEDAASIRRTVQRSVARDIAAPMLASWFHTMLAECCSTGVRRLVFVNRDGYLLAPAMRLLIEGLGLDLEVDLIHGSRQSWVGAAAAPDPAAWQSLLAPAARDRSGLGAFDLLARLGVDPATLPSLGAEDGAADAWQLLLRSEGPFEQWKRRLVQDAELVIRYLVQERVGDDHPWAFVDLGTGGTLSRSVVALYGAPEDGCRRSRSTGGSSEQTGRSRSDRAATSTTSNAGRGGPNQRTPSRSWRRSASPPSAPRSATKTPTRASLRSWGGPSNGWRPGGRTQVHNAVLDYFGNAPTPPISRPERAALLEQSVRRFRRFWDRPTRHEAEIWGEFPFEDGWGHERIVRELSPALTARRIATVPVRGRLGFVHRDAWDAGTLGRSDPRLRWVTEGLLALRGA